MRSAEPLIRNFGIVSDSLFRSGRYNSTGLAQLAGLGIRTCIDLRDNPKQLLGSRTYVQHNVELIRVLCNEQEPLPWLTIVEIVDKALAKGNVLVHCWKGAHRTGAFAGIWRFLRDGWTQSQAWDEAKQYGFGDPDSHRALAISAFGEYPWH